MELKVEDFVGGSVEKEAVEEEEEGGVQWE